MAGIGLFLVTSTVGRAWCGYACPQTVWTDLFLHIERRIDGDRNAQQRLRKAPLSLSKVARRGLKHGLWLLVALLTGGAWVFYFADAPTLARSLVSGEASYIAYATIAVLTATTYIFGGFMREQVCLYMCPWPRIQGGMLDERSLIVTYKDWRGEPRSHGLKRSESSGDCVDCQACVQVCPVGIDIRDGAQFACITCALCIDACDEVMAKVGRPRGLIDYATYEDCKAEATGAAPIPVMRTLLRPRTLVYFSLWGGVGLAMAFALGTRTRLDIAVGHDRNPLWVQLSEGDVRNAYTIKIRNMESRPRTFQLSLGELPGGKMWDSLSSEDQAARLLTFTVPADQVSRHRVYVQAPPNGVPQTDFSFILAAKDDRPVRAVEVARFNRPEVRP
jgi:cytochrome c oxidase accessory protein FixG